MNGKRIVTNRLDWSGENGNGNIKNCSEDEEIFLLKSG
jgi:hypothetical protein